jgi:hypothetical protein
MLEVGMSELTAFICGLFSMFCVGVATLAVAIQRLRKPALYDGPISPHDAPAAMARKLQRRRRELGEARHRLKTRAAQLRGLKWEMEQLGPQNPLDPFTSKPTLGQQLYKNRIAKLDEEIYKLRVCQSLTDKMLQTGKLLLDMLAVEAHVEEIMPDLLAEREEVIEQLTRFRELESAFEEVRLSTLASDEVTGLLAS